jgi:broad specificity phosphatase PhoE
MIELFLIRHGTTTLPDHFIGETDVPLSPVGIKELQELSGAIVKRFLSSERPLAAIYSSDLQRSIESARILADMSGITPLVVPALRELGFGAWEGLTYEQITERYPEEFAAWKKAYNRKGPPGGGESMATLRRRVIKALDQILACHKNGERIAIVAHGGVNRVILCHFLGLPLNRIFSLGQQHGAMNVIELRDGRAVVRILNWQP